MGVNLFGMLEFQLHDRNGLYIQRVDTNQYIVQYPNILFSAFIEVSGYCHRPQVDPSVKPVSQGIRRLTFTVREDVFHKLKRLEDKGIIEKVNASLWISNLLIARQKNGELRLCVDLKQVNKAVIPDKNPTL